MNIPNIITSVRILIALIAPFFLIEGSLWVRLIAGFFIFIAIATDWLDGWYARKYNKVTRLGKFLDPIADKVLILITFSVFVYLDVLSVWWIIPIFIREIVVTFYRFIFLSKNIIVASTVSGKIKTVMQMGTIGVAYVFLMTNKHFRAYFSEYSQLLLYIALVATISITVFSGVRFIVRNWHLIKRYHQIS